MKPLIPHLRRLAPATATVLLLLVGARLGFTAEPNKSSTNYYGVYLNDSRIGRAVNTRRPTQHKGQPAILLTTSTSIKLRALGDVEIQIDMSHLIGADGRPISLRMVTKSSGQEVSVDARYYANRIEAVQTTGGKSSQKTIPIPAGITLIGDPDLEFQGKSAKQALQVGVKRTFHFFEPVSLTIQRLDIEVLRKEEREFKGEKVTAFLVRAHSELLGTSEKWLDESGRLLEDTSATGIRLVLETSAGAPEKAYAPPQDFALVTAVRTKKPLRNPRKLRALSIRFSGLPNRGLVLSDARQTASAVRKDGNTYSAAYQITVTDPPRHGLALLPPNASTAYLQDGPLLGIREGEIAKQARQITGAETDRAEVARRIRAWVYGHMAKPTNIALPRRAEEILSSKEGVCRDYATLFTALARSAGIPTRICAGVVYHRNRFFYHAWVECQLQEGANGWTPFDPTLPTDFVDATHIKFVQGEPADIYKVAGLVGSLKAEVLTGAGGGASRKGD